ncbi:hypothetical protein NOR_06858 [Metarhizium rileyi]|uniref:Uncharacterized protein n=1 Tax=Metarhizium rileyi (strain RCEF 4871) TaxID=1649241 RepID=A0A166ZP95_METRR|nr:hypothetical protein NOR_06858 [Metarhizium rileyi RCEF 4871]
MDASGKTKARRTRNHDECVASGLTGSVVLGAWCLVLGAWDQQTKVGGSSSTQAGPQTSGLAQAQAQVHRRWHRLVWAGAVGMLARAGKGLAWGGMGQ